MTHVPNTEQGVVGSSGQTRSLAFWEARLRNPVRKLSVNNHTYQAMKVKLIKTKKVKYFYVMRYSDWRLRSLGPSCEL